MQNLLNIERLGPKRSDKLLLANFELIYFSGTESVSKKWFELILLFTKSDSNKALADEKIMSD